MTKKRKHARREVGSVVEYLGATAVESSTVSYYSKNLSFAMDNKNRNQKLPRLAIPATTTENHPTLPKTTLDRTDYLWKDLAHPQIATDHPCQHFKTSQEAVHIAHQTAFRRPNKTTLLFRNLKQNKTKVKKIKIKVQPHQLKPIHNPKQIGI